MDQNCLHKLFKNDHEQLAITQQLVFLNLYRAFNTDIKPNLIIRVLDHI